MSVVARNHRMQDRKLQTVASGVRREDARLLTGEGNFVDDHSVGDTCYGVVVRSPYPHAIIERIDISGATSIPGVRTVITAADLDREGIGGLPCVSSFSNSDGSEIFKPFRPVLAIQTVRYVGEPVAFVVADTLATAHDAAELVVIDYAELPSTSNHLQSLQGTPEIWSECQNIAFDWCMGEKEDFQSEANRATHVVSIEIQHPRMAAAPLEPRSARGEYCPASQSYTLIAQTQGVHGVRRVIAENILKIPLEQLRVITPDVGGSFGMKIFTYPEYALVLIAARKIGMAVRWIATRTESFLSDTQSRARTDYATLALDQSGKIVALSMDIVADLGAYLSHVGPNSPSIYAATVVGHTYKIPVIYLRSRGIFTNAPPTDAFRGAGKPETICTVEQLIDKAAHQLGMDRIKLRQINFVQPEDLPYSMPNNQVIDSGNFNALLERALAMASFRTFEERKLKSQKSGKLRGLGLGMYMHSTGGSVAEVCEVRLLKNGSVQVLTGTQAAGQGHETALAHMVAQFLQIHAENIEVRQGDTALLEVGGGTGGSSFTPIAGNTAYRAVEEFLDRTRQMAGEILEASAHDIEYNQGKFSVAGTDVSITLQEIALRLDEQQLESDGCVGRAGFDGVNTTHPCGAYVAEIECDPETGILQLINLVGVDDLGTIINTQLVDGQLHGAWAQAIGTSIMESVVFDETDSGQPQNSTFMDYQLPRASDVPSFELEKCSTICQTNPLGVKGAGEVASLGAPGALLNALSDMLSDDTFVVVDPPATPLRMWQLINRHRKPPDEPN